MIKVKNFYILILAFFLHGTSIFAESGWQFQVSGTSVFLRSVHFTSPTTGWVVGDAGIILKTTNGGDNWFAQSSNTTTNLYSVHFPNSSTGYICGSSGIILKTSNGGDNWLTQTSATAEQLYSIYFVSATLGFTVGFNGTILKTVNGGINWTPQISGTTDYLFSTQFTSSNTGWAVGGSPFTKTVILKTTNAGTNWTSQTGDVTGLLSVHFTSPTTGCGVGSFGGVLYTTDGGVNWENRTSHIILTGELRSVHMTSPTTGYVTKSGKIYKTTTSCHSWIIQEIDNSNILSDIYFTSPTTGWTVGNNGTILKTTNGGTSTFYFNLSVLLEGFYDANSGYMKGDMIRVTPFYATPYPLGIQPANGFLDSTGHCTLTFYDADHSTPIYFVINHRNSIETWTDTSMRFSSFSLTYDFTTAASQAYGNNMILKGTEYCIYSGDVNQDDVVDGVDKGVVDNNAFNFVTGYVPADVTGDNLVDGSDAAIVDNNAFNFVTKIAPFGFESGPQNQIKAVIQSK